VLFFFVAMKKTDPNKKKPTRSQTKKQKHTLEPVPVHPEQVMKTALDIALQKAREIGKKYSEEEGRNFE